MRRDNLVYAALLALPGGQQDLGEELTSSCTSDSGKKQWAANRTLYKAAESSTWDARLRELVKTRPFIHIERKESNKLDRCQACKQARNVNCRALFFRAGEYAMDDFYDRRTKHFFSKRTRCCGRVAR